MCILVLIIKTINTASCGRPVAATNVQLYYNSTLEGATVVFLCEEGYVPNSTHTGVCQDNGRWSPNPANHICDETKYVTCQVFVLNSDAYTD